MPHTTIEDEHVPEANSSPRQWMVEVVFLFTALIATIGWLYLLFEFATSIFR